MRAARELQAVRCHDEQAVGGHADVHAVKEQIADRNKRALQPTTLDAKERPKAHGSRKEQIDQRVRLFLKNMQKRQSENRSDHAQDAETREKYDAREEDAEHERQIGIDFEQTEVAHAPDSIGEKRHAEEAQ